MVAPVSRALIGNRSAVVVRTPQGDIAARQIPAGSITLIGAKSSLTVEMDAGAHAIMSALRRVQPLEDATGEPGTVGGMLATVRQTTAELTTRALTISASATCWPSTRSSHRKFAAAGRRVPARERRGTRRDGAHKPSSDGAGRPGDDRDHRHPSADRGRRGEHGRPRRAHHPGTAEPPAILDLGGGSTHAALALPGERSAPNTWPAPAIPRPAHRHRARPRRPRSGREHQATPPAKVESRPRFGWRTEPPTSTTSHCRPRSSRASSSSTRTAEWRRSGPPWARANQARPPRHQAPRIRDELTASARASGAHGTHPHHRLRRPARRLRARLRHPEMIRRRSPNTGSSAAPATCAAVKYLERRHERPDPILREPRRLNDDPNQPASPNHRRSSWPTATSGCTEALREICAGIEEEGMQSESIALEATDATALAYEVPHGHRARRRGGRARRSLHPRRRPPADTPLESRNASSRERACQRHIGHNAARLAKAMPLKGYGDGSETDGFQSCGAHGERA